jgi:hypothetical protein
VAPRPITPRTVKPRKPYTADLPAMAVTARRVLLESGEVHERAYLPELLAEHPSALVACANPPRLVAELDEHLADHPLWQFRLSPVVRDVWKGGETIERREEVIVNFFGFKRPNGRSRNRYFYPLAPGTFVRRSIQEIRPDAPNYLHALLDWIVDVRTFCLENDLRPSPTAGGLASQLLRDQRFYPLPRRKVPTRTNEKARPHLPGNCYELRADPERVYAAARYIDQQDAHHFAASTIKLPHADGLRARGRFRDLEPKPWAKPGSRAWDLVTSQHGLLFGRFEIPRELAWRRYVPPELTRPGPVDRWVYTHELDDWIALGARPRWISAAWTSPIADDGLQAYARNARRWIHDPENAERKPWLKPTLLAAYGVLAAKPRRLTFAYRRSEKGDVESWTVGPREIEVMVRRTSREQQSPIANVIQRGMIEAETRRLSLSLARELEEAHGREVLAVYADAVIVRDNRSIDSPELPLLPEPWRLKERLTHLQFIHQQAFTSLEIRRLPGVSRSLIESTHRRNTNNDPREDHNGSRYQHGRPNRTADLRSRASRDERRDEGGPAPARVH